MATKLYLPSSGSGPLGSLAVDSNWELSTAMVRRPCYVYKTNSSLSTTQLTWGSTTTQQWCWYQFQSPRLAAGYSWTTSDTVSMVIGKCAETTNSGDSHLAYVVRVVSGDGSTIRGVIGLYHATSTEFPLMASAATRIHSARTGGATNFSSQAGDRIIIEIGLHGFSPALELIQMRVGDPTATEDFALTAALTTDLCSWVELSRTVSFDLTSKVSAYVKGKDVAKADTDAFTTANVAVSGSTDAFTSGILRDHTDAYTKGGIEVNDSSPSYTEGLSLVEVKAQTPAFIAVDANDKASVGSYLVGSETLYDNTSAYAKGEISEISEISAFSAGQDDAKDNKPSNLTGCLSELTQLTAYLSGNSSTYLNLPAFVSGQDIASSSTTVYAHGATSESSVLPGYILGSEDTLGDTPAYTLGSTQTYDSAPAYTEGYVLVTYIPEIEWISVVVPEAWNVISSTKSACLSGSSNTLSNIDAYTTGQSHVSASQKVYLSGSSDTLSETSAYLNGSIDVNVSIPALTSGISTETSNVPAYTIGSSETSDTTQAYTNGAIPVSVSSSSPAYLTGNCNTTTSQHAYLDGSLETTSSTPSYLRGQIYVLSSVSGYIAGQQDVQSHQDAYTHGKATAEDTQTAFATGQVQSTSSQASFLVGLSTNVAVQHAYTRGGLGTSTSIPAYTYSDRVQERSSAHAFMRCSRQPDYHLLGSLVTDFEFTGNFVEYTLEGKVDGIATLEGNLNIVYNLAGDLTLEHELEGHL